MPYALDRLAPLTLSISFPGQQPLILDGGDVIGESGFRSGAVVEPVLEAHPGNGVRTRNPIATLTVLSGQQEGVEFFASAEENAIGRERTCRIHLLDPTVSRQHAILRSVPGGIEIEDLGSVNGTTSLEEHSRVVRSEGGVLRFGGSGSATIAVGTVPIRVQVGPPSVGAAPPPATLGHLQSPVVQPEYQPDAVELPAPPSKPEQSRLPLIAMVAPILMGTALYLFTHSVMSLMFVALSPLIMLGTWLDSYISGKRKYKAKAEEFDATLASVRRELEISRFEEQLRRNAEAPSSEEMLGLPGNLDPLLWTRRPEHGSFLEVRLGLASLPSRKELTLPPRADIAHDDWQLITALRDEFLLVPSVPLVERLDESGSIGVGGTSMWLSSAARSVIIQLSGLHSPADVVLTAFANGDQAEDEWAWLKWLPHVNSAYSPLSSPHLTSDAKSADALLIALESLIAQRSVQGVKRTPRTFQGGGKAGLSVPAKASDAGGSLPRIIVLVLDPGFVNMSRLVTVAETGPDVGVHLIWVSEDVESIPAACRTVVVAGNAGSEARFVRRGETVPFVAMELVDRIQAESFARTISPISDIGAKVLDETDLPRSVTLDKLVSEDVLGSTQAVLRRWQATDSLTSSWMEGKEREDAGLVGVVGQGSSGPVEIDLRTHGPHALVGGTTGSGKSEFLQTWILSLAASYSPDRLTFLLVDYKGGAAFADCVELPHTVGLVTDLNTHLVRRALTSLRAELRRREEILASKAAKDLLTLERRGDPEAPPTLVIVIDEFAALVGEIPEFVDGVIDVAQRGRSLGLHLVMATQRPAGVIKDNLRANTNLRVALRMADEADSQDVIGVKDAAQFPADLPGRAVVKIGAGHLAHFQTAYLGGHHDQDTQEAVEVADLRFGTQGVWPLVPERESRTKVSKESKRDIELLVRNISSAAAEAGVFAPRKPWVDQLAEVLPLSEVRDLSVPKPSPESGAFVDYDILVGIVDEPEFQRQSPYALTLGEAGNAVIYGGPGTGKTTTLITCAVSAIQEDPRTEVYGIDAAGGKLAVLEVLPRVGNIVPSDERGRVIRLLSVLKSTIESRASDPASSTWAPILLLVDGIGAFKDEYEQPSRGTDPFADLVSIARGGRAVGVHVLFTAERTNGFPSSLAASTPERFALRLPADTDYQAVGVPLGILEEAPAGRVVRVGSNEEIQWAWPTESSETDDLEGFLDSLAASLIELDLPEPKSVPRLPDVIMRANIQETDIPVGSFAIDMSDMVPIVAPTEGTLLVTGPGGSGKTTAILSLVEAITDRSAALGVPLDAVLLSPSRSSMRRLPVWSRCGDSAQDREDLIEDLIVGLGGAPKASPTVLPMIGLDPILDTPAEPEHVPVEPFPRAGHQPLVVVENIGDFDGSGNEQRLATLLKDLRRKGILTIVEGENATLGAVWELSSAVKGSRWAIALQPDVNDSPAMLGMPFTYARRSDYAPGRGYLIKGGVARDIQVALPNPPAAPDPGW